MGKGDKRTAKGKRFAGSHGAVRPRKPVKKTAAAPAKTTVAAKKAPAKKAPAKKKAS